MKNKKLVLLITSIILIFIIFLIIYLNPSDYKTNYTIDKVKITEKYHKEEKYYEFNLNYKNKKYDIISLDKYTTKRNLISKVNIKEKDKETCLYFDSLITLYPICSKNKEYYSPFSKNDTEFKEKDNYENIKIDSLNNKTFLLWNYHDFYYLNNKKRTKINLFKKEIYNLNLIYQMDNYLIIPDYNSDYQFKKMYLINSNNTKVKEQKLRYEIYFESYFLGSYDNKVYLYDNKNNQELYLDLKKKEIYKTDYKILNNGKWENTTNQKLKNNKLTFKNKEIFNYTLENGTLKATSINSKISFKVTNKKVDKIIKINNLDVYYLVNDTLFYFNPIKGEVALLKYSEWKFNNNNMIFIF